MQCNMQSRHIRRYNILGTNIGHYLIKEHLIVTNILIICLLKKYFLTLNGLFHIFYL